MSCGQKSTDDLIKDKNTTALNKRKSELQAELSKIETAFSRRKNTRNKLFGFFINLKRYCFNHYLEIQGSVETKENILIQPEFSGTLVALNVKAGQRVSKGQILGKIDDAGMSQQLASIENQYALAKTTFERQKKKIFGIKKLVQKYSFTSSNTNDFSSKSSSSNESASGKNDN